jgi:hypothetical protein
MSKYGFNIGSSGTRAPMGFASKIGASNQGMDVGQLFDSVNSSEDLNNFFANKQFKASDAITQDQLNRFNILKSLGGQSANDYTKVGEGLSGGLGVNIGQKALEASAAYQKALQGQDLSGGSATSDEGNIGNTRSTSATKNGETVGPDMSRRGYTTGTKAGTTMADIIRAGGANADLNKFLTTTGFGGADNTDLLNASGAQGLANLQSRVKQYLASQGTGRRIKVGQ